MTYSEKVLVMAGSKIIGRALGMITKGELVRATMTWKQTHFSVVMSGSFQLLHRSASGERDAMKGAAPSTTHDLTMPKEFSLDDVHGHVHTTQRVTIPPFGIINIHGNIQGHCIWVNVFVKPAWGPSCLLLNTKYGELHPVSSWVPISSRNLSTHPIIIPTKVVVGKVTPANWVPLVALPVDALGELTHDLQKDWILEELNHQGLEEWPKEE